MKADSILRLGAFIIVFVGIVSFYVFYGEQSVLDSVFFVVLTVSTVGYDDKIAPTIAIRLFTVFTMLFGILFLFTYIKNIVHSVGRVLKRRVLPTLSLQHYMGGLVIVSFSSLFVILAVGTVFVYFNEGLHFVDALYFIVYTATTVGYGGVPIHFHSTKIFLIFYVLIAPILLAISFDSILSLPMRIRRKRLITDLLLNRRSLAVVMVDLERQQKRVHRLRRQQRTRMQNRSFLQRFSSPGTTQQHSHTSHNDAQTNQENVVVTPGCIDQYHVKPLSSTCESKSSIHNNEEMKTSDSAVFQIDPELQIEAPHPDNLSVHSTPQRSVQPNHESPQDNVSEHSDSDSPGILFGRTRHEPPTMTGMFGLRDGASVRKYEFVLSVLLYLGKIQYEKDVYVWAKKFDRLDVNGTGVISTEYGKNVVKDNDTIEYNTYVSLQELLEVYRAAADDDE